MDQVTIERDELPVALGDRPLRCELVSPGVRRELVLRRLLKAYGHVRLDETARQLALDALGVGQLGEVRADDEAWLIATLDMAGREVADAALEQLAAVIAASLAAAPPSLWGRFIRSVTWRDVDGL